jgi:hypothetical protein
MSEVTIMMHQITDKIRGSDAKTFKLLYEQWNILLNAQKWIIRNNYK